MTEPLIIFCGSCDRYTRVVEIQQPEIDTTGESPSFVARFVVRACSHCHDPEREWVEKLTAVAKKSEGPG